MNPIAGPNTAAGDAVAHVPVERQIVWLLLLCPALAGSDTLSHALILGAAAIIAGGVTFIASAALRSCNDVIRGTLCMLVLATLASVLDLAISAWLHESHQTLALFVPLLAANVALLWRAEQTSVEPAGPAAFNAGLRLGGSMALLLSLLALARELVGRGSLLHDAAALLGGGAWSGGLGLQLFRVDMGFLLAVLPPGAFISFGLLLAARNWLRSRPKHEQAQDR